MGTLAIAPAAVAFPVVFALTYFLCVGPRRALALSFAGADPAGGHRDLARDRRHARGLQRLLPGPQGRGAHRLVAGALVAARRRRRHRGRSMARRRRAARYEVSSSRRAARRLRRRASHQAPPAKSTKARPRLPRRARRGPRPRSLRARRRPCARTRRCAGRARQPLRDPCRAPARSGRTQPAAGSHGRRGARWRALGVGQAASTRRDPRR